MATGQRPKVYVTRRVPQKGVDMLKESCEVTQWNSDDVVPRDELLRNVADVDALFCLLTDKIDNELLDAAGPNLKVVGTMSVGYDHVDLAECTRRNIPVGFTPGVLTEAVAELTVALLLSTARRLPEGVHAAKAGLWGTWGPLWLCGATLVNSTVGIVGFGRIGYACAKRLQPFGVSKILYHDAYQSDKAHEVGAESVDLDTLLQESDFVLACTSLTPETMGMFNKNLFGKMKSSAIFINTSRGGVVNQDDLVDALKQNQIRAAGLDVTVPEPLPTNHPLFSLPNCVVLPHIASATDDTRSQMSELTANNILAALGKKPMPAQAKL